MESSNKVPAGPTWDEYAEATKALHAAEKAVQDAQTRYRKALDALNAEVLR